MSNGWCLDSKGSLQIENNSLSIVNFMTKSFQTDLLTGLTEACKYFANICGVLNLLSDFIDVSDCHLLTIGIRNVKKGFYS